MVVGAGVEMVEHGATGYPGHDSSSGPEVLGEMVVMVVMVGLGDLVEGEETVAVEVMVACLLSRLLIPGCWCWLRQTAYERSTREER